MDSLNWEKTLNIGFNDSSLIFFLQNSSYLNQHMINDYSFKVSDLDVILLSTNSINNNFLTFYLSFINDINFSFVLQNIVPLTYFLSSYQSIFSLLSIYSPEVILIFNEYFLFYYSNSIFNSIQASYFDSYSNNLNYNFNENLTSLFMFFFFS
jgi:hypothetical protein